MRYLTGAARNKREAGRTVFRIPACCYQVGICSCGARRSLKCKRHGSQFASQTKTVSPAELKARPAELVVAALGRGVPLSQVSSVRRQLVRNHALRQVCGGPTGQCDR